VWHEGVVSEGRRRRYRAVRQRRVRRFPVDGDGLLFDVRRVVAVLVEVAGALADKAPAEHL